MILTGKSRAAYERAMYGMERGETDEALAVALMAKVNGDRRALARARRAVPAVDAEDSYSRDRARRVLSALAEDREIRPPAAHLRELYREEQALRELPVAEGLARVVALEPRLTDVVRRFGADADGRGGLKRKEALARRAGYSRELRSIVGPDSGAADPLLATRTAVVVASKGLFDLWPRYRAFPPRSVS